METLLLLGGLAGIIQLIVIIILIIKFFHLINDVNEIKAKYLKAKNDQEEYELLLIKKEYNEIYKILINRITKKIRNAYYDFDESYYNKEFDKIITSYSPKFVLIQKEIPEYILSYKDRNILKNIIG